MRTIIPTIVAAVLCVACTTQSGVSQVDRIPTDKTNTNYYSNVAPLLPQQMIKLPTGSIKPEGWLRKQLELQKDGLNGHLGEISIWLQKGDNAWLTTGGHWGWEEVPYWLRGYASLSYIMEDPEMSKEAQLWIEAILASQREDGNFGPVVMNWGSKQQDLWPNMIALWILQDYQEYTGDERVIPFMTKYFEYQMTVPDEDFLEGYWENSRAGDNLWSVVWLYNRTKNPMLLELAEKIHANTADWTKSTELPNWHNVNIAQCFREPAEYYMLNGDEAFLKATYNNQSLIRRAFGQVPGGMWGGDENSRIGFFDPRQGTETCAFAEQMASDEILLLITGDPAWADNLEDVAFNSYPAAFMPDMKALRYITSPNQSISDATNHAPGIDNGGPFMAMNPFSSRCCQHNHGFGWPFYNEFLVMATPDNGAAVALYNACKATVKVADGVEITLAEDTRYPFEETVEFTVGTPQQVTFPLYLRIPSWCKGAKAKVNGKAVGGELAAGKYLRIEREWQDGDKVALELPMAIATRSWQVNKNSVSVDYGPLTLSLKIGERYEMRDSRDCCMGDSRWQEDVDVNAWPTYEIFPTTDWNYALATDAEIVPVRGTWPDDDNPFTIESSPISFKAKGRIVPEWTIDEYGLTGVLPYEDAPKADKVDDITLVPMGTARLRISAFPTCSAK